MSHLEAKVETAPVDRDDFQCFGLSHSSAQTSYHVHVFLNEIPGITHRIHGAGIYANIWGILMGSMLPYIAYMEPMGYVWPNGVSTPHQIWMKFL